MSYDESDTSGDALTESTLDTLVYGWKLARLKQEMISNVDNLPDDQYMKEEKRNKIRGLWQHMKDRSERIHAGYVEDLRTTDYAWFDTEVYHMQLVRLDEFGTSDGWNAVCRPPAAAPFSSPFPQPLALACSPRAALRAKA